MKIFFMSDIHGSLNYLQKALNRFNAEKADFIVILGDELYHGARNPLPLGYNPKDVAELLNTYSEKIIAIRGNCDSEVDEMVLTYPIMSTYSTILYNDKRLFLTHGHVYNEDNLPKLRDGDIFLYGHTHVPVAKKKNNIYIINPGSISIPKEDSPNSYAVLCDNLFEIKDLDGNTFLELNINE
ncbi:phosphodiesterase [Clostridium felsineum]|uniref:Phosphoesterase n=1 Tax=Clostridium felsineum TaxID=36839 RepID=A0A1S8KYR9_9CLOT|nr:phosphodiesterase [Clostridium felsineum]MCR3760861.1 phosphodiesterase [Clostridium felsineum]URZ03967.1 Phosphodiesterase YfcE [Clostridium felsineum]URZ07769.1 Phosphodiesterase YfcE [Clostridium felsineum]URZ12800.1 Phosphodiesterase YfcE [Clostridium felsineum]